MPQHNDPAVSSTLLRAARALTDFRTLAGTLDAIVHATRDTVPGFDHVGISVLHRDGTIETQAATTPFARVNDSLQYELGEGPCMQALVGDGIVIVEHAATEERWPAYMARALETGLQAQMGLQLYNHEGVLGSLNLYSIESETIDEEAPMIAELFAAHAAIALGHVREVGQLRDALSTRKVIGQAIGVIMERYGMGEDRAFQYLVRASSTSNTKLRDVAHELVGQTPRSTGREAGARPVNWTSVTSTSTGTRVAHD